MSDLQELILQSTSKLLKENCTKELLDEVEAGKWPQDLWNTIVDSGLLQIGISEENGGAGGDFSDAFHLFKLIGEYAVPLPIFETIFINWIITKHGVKSLESPSTFALGCEIEANFVDESLQINGELNNVPWANCCENLLINIVNEENQLFALIDREQYKVEKKRNLAGEPEDKVMLDNVLIPLKYVFQDENELNDKFIEIGALAKSAMMSGALNKILELTIKHVKEREQFGRPLYKLQAIQQNIAILSGETISANTITDYAIDSFNNVESIYNIGATKIVVNESANTVSEIAHQVHGAIGTTYEHPLHHFTRRLWTWRDQFGNETYWAKCLATECNDLQKSLWSTITK